MGVTEIPLQINMSHTSVAECPVIAKDDSYKLEFFDSQSQRTKIKDKQKKLEKYLLEIIIRKKHLT